MAVEILLSRSRLLGRDNEAKDCNVQQEIAPNKKSAPIGALFEKVYRNIIFSFLLQLVLLQLLQLLEQLS